MKKITTILILLLFLTMGAPAQANTESKSDVKTDGLEIVVTSLDINDKSLNLTYDINNNSQEDVWIITGSYSSTGSRFGMGTGANVSEDGLTLAIGLHFNKENHVMPHSPTYARFVRLPPGKSQTESVLMEIPVYPKPQYDHKIRQGQATKLAIELGYFQGNLPELIYKRYEEKINKRPLTSSGIELPYFFFTAYDHLISRDEEFFTLWLGEIKSEEISRTVVENILIPYEEISYRKERYELPDLTSCKKIEIKYQPSTLDYFFPFAFQKKLLNSEELKYLQSEKTFVLEDTEQIKILSDDVSNAITDFTSGGAIVIRYRNHVGVNCSYDSKPAMSLLIYNDNDIKIEGNVIPCPKGFPSLKTLTPHIKAIDLRMQCAANLQFQWYRFRFHNFNESIRLNEPSIRDQIIYPTPAQWCDDIIRPYTVPDPDKTIIYHWDTEAHICPSAGEGRNHYAMNPNCEPNSPGDMVLLFETKAGWNQHGGPELFTFENHELKGGCVLLNDGTVKFIRTKEELNALRWE